MSLGIGNLDFVSPCRMGLHEKPYKKPNGRQYTRDQRPFKKYPEQVAFHTGVGL
jgi:hypothetical protein